MPDEHAHFAGEDSFQLVCERYLTNICPLLPDNCPYAEGVDLKNAPTEAETTIALQNILHKMGFDEEMEWEERGGADGDYDNRVEHAVATFIEDVNSLEGRAFDVDGSQITDEVKGLIREKCSQDWLHYTLSIVRPQNNSSFITDSVTSFTIRCETRIEPQALHNQYAQTIQWRISRNDNSGPPQDLTGTGNEWDAVISNFVNGRHRCACAPTHPEPHPDYPNRTRCDSCQGRQSSLSYEIEASVQIGNQTRARIVKITQDDIDRIRQMYVDHGIRVPRRNQFSPNGTIPIRQAVNNDLATAVAQYRQHVTNQLTAARNQLQNTPNLSPAQQQTLQTIITNLGLVANYNQFGISNGFRNPVRNSQVGGVLNSRHQYGTAVDLSPVPTFLHVLGGTLRQRDSQAIHDTLENLGASRSAVEYPPNYRHVHYERRDL